jgi:hypothetical protein
VETEVRRKSRAALVTHPLPDQGEKLFPGAISPAIETLGFRKGQLSFETTLLYDLDRVA